MLVAADAIVNHLDKIEKISLGQFKPKVILKTVVDDGGIFYSGPTHSQNFTEAFRKMIEFPVIVPNTAEEVIDAYNFALECKRSVMIVELKTLLTK
jgi:pyruvate/2-oxoglutarate/acetoin dehydrogenase E1 component